MTAADLQLFKDWFLRGKSAHDAGHPFGKNESGFVASPEWRAWREGWRAAFGKAMQAKGASEPPKTVAIQAEKVHHLEGELRRESERVREANIRAHDAEVAMEEACARAAELGKKVAGLEDQLREGNGRLRDRLKAVQHTLLPLYPATFGEPDLALSAAREILRSRDRSPTIEKVCFLEDELREERERVFRLEHDLKEAQAERDAAVAVRDRVVAGALNRREQFETTGRLLRASRDQRAKLAEPSAEELAEDFRFTHGPNALLGACDALVDARRGSILAATPDPQPELDEVRKILLEGEPAGMTTVNLAFVKMGELRQWRRHETEVYRAGAEVFDHIDKARDALLRGKLVGDDKTAESCRDKFGTMPSRRNER